MSLFQCEKCGVIENTALTNGYVGWTFSDPSHWTGRMRVERGLEVGKKYCSLCFDGKWHGQFPREVHPIGTLETDKVGNITQKRDEALKGEKERG